MGLILLFQFWNIVGGGGGGVFIFFIFRGVRLGEKLKVIHFGIKYEAKVWRREEEEEEEEQVARI